MTSFTTNRKSRPQLPTGHRHSATYR